MKQIPYGKNLVIKEESFKQFKQESKQRLEKAIEGEKTESVLSFDNPEKIRQLLTEKRLELMQKLMNEDPESITQLAEQLDRNVKEVHNDLKLLEENKIVFFEKQGRKKKPIIPYNDIKVDYSITKSLTEDSAKA
ncbi:HVO_A0114 family putative DNA-binding protein [Candidatus Nanohalobium constans]|uniref:HTH domain protein n=1 Tax=Candidatus Nanohalobium constans TaxID=2565781 RepID=A0A5Q0UH66_9ARCH|nr:HTH domain-containing protein [Candidatus Nanohalobium constans]QGA80934.1 HTH domain protein [Candidatus Nanohalobium constans]